MNNADIKSLVPELRFPEFESSDQWSRYALNEVTTYVDYRGKGPNKSNKGVFLVTAKNIKQGYIDYEISKEYVPEAEYNEVMRKGKPRFGDILFTTEAPLGNVAQVNDENIALAQRVIKFRACPPLVNSFLKHYMLSDGFQNLLKKESIGSTVKGIQGKVLHKLPIFLPSQAEQEKIAECLSSIDDSISSHTKKLDSIKNHRKGLMQQLFPAEDETTPKLRFAEFSDAGDWEKRSFSKLFEIGGGKDHKHLAEGTIPVYGSGGYMRSVDSFLYDGESACIGRKGTINKPMYLEGKFWTVDTLFYTHSFKNCSAKFVYLLFQNINWLKLNEAGGVPSLSKVIINKVEVRVPSQDEQNRIVEAIWSIDKLITEQAKKLESLKDHKKGLLQKLFPSIKEENYHD